MTAQATRVVAQPEAKTLRIAMIAACPFPYPRGTPVRIHRLSSALAGRGHEVHVFTYHLGNASVADDIEIHRVPRIGTYRKVTPGPSYQKLLVVDPVMTMQLYFSLRRSVFDIIHAHHYEGLVIAALARAGLPIPIIYDAHTLLGSELKFFRLGFSRRFASRIGTALDRSLPRLGDHIISVTETIRDQLIAYGIEEERITVVTNGVEHDLFVPQAPRSASTLIFTGNLAAYQGIEHLLRAFAKVARKRPDARLLLVTDSLFKPYEALAAELGVRDRVSIEPGPFAEHPNLLGKALVALNPRTECDGIPQKLLNYMAAGCATVSFDGSAPCVEHGKTGWLVPNGDIDAFAEGILKLLEDPQLALRLGEQARKSVLERYTWEFAAEKSEAVYHKQLEGAVHPVASLPGAPGSYAGPSERRTRC